MKKKYIILIIVALVSCADSARKETVQTQEIDYFKLCMDTFRDEKKCREFEKKSKDDAASKKKEAVKSKYTDEELSKVRIRSDLKSLLLTKSRLYVTEEIGEPDSSSRDGSGNEIMTYTRPVSRYSPDHDPDKEFKVYFVRDRVSKITHIPPDTTPDGFSMEKILGNSKEKKK
ncbi:MAG TPA: hypothetical protein PL048_23945 [Leptospiraceae bacterium]|nr:hypothetical protein [Leptospiraceae bacterium]HMY68432.1 hypothetical protein [Leptospiraceae bacterium]HMZ61844.1 hypothetical protein [Leptospiraceae bacterium]HNF14122.1 hypothetical protein [Leptospiraceae bacterium]HNF26539.1 hypothetical protein [Leptospiraceae bacterium]